MYIIPFSVNWIRQKFIENSVTMLGVGDSSVGQRSDLQYIERRFTADWVFYWYGTLASPSLQIGSMALKYHGKKNGGPNQWIIQIHLSFLVKSSRILGEWRNQLT